MGTERLCPGCGRALAADSPQGLCPECLIKAGFGTGAAPEAGKSTTQPLFTPPPVTELAKLFPQLEILDLVGWGGMGAVYRARQPSLQRVVALKILPSQSTQRPGFAERFTREAQALARLNHPNIVAVHEFGEAGGMPYFIMEFVEGLTLRQVVQQRRLGPREALQIVPQICDALQYAHDEGVVHRDIKPENILIDRKGRVKIADFGIAKILGSEQIRQTLTQGQVLGTPHYMAPEQIEHPQTVDHRADIYSLGVVFYEMLTGELPLGKFAPPSRKVDLDVRLDEIVLHALEKEPERRYQHASEVKTDVEMVAEKAQANPPPVSTQPVSQATTSDLRRRRTLWYGFIVSLIGLPIGIVMKLPLVWGLAACGIIVGGLKLDLFNQAFGGEGTTGKPSQTGQPLAQTRAPRSASSLRWLLAVFLLPPVLFTLFVLIGYRWAGLDLDADIQAWTGLLGLPLSTAVGALLAWAAWLLIRSPQTRSEGLASIPARWSWLALGAAVVLGISLPLGGASLVLLQLASQDPSWHPASGEFVFTVICVGGAVLAGLAATFMGWESWARIRRAPTAFRGRAVAFAAAWYWPCLLACLAIAWGADTSLSTLTGGNRRYSPAVIVSVERKLELEITRRLKDAGWQPESVSVSVSPDLTRGECRFGTVRKGGLSFEPFNAAIRLRPQTPGLWLVEGEGEFSALRFSVDTSEALENVAGFAAGTGQRSGNHKGGQDDGAKAQVTPAGTYETEPVTRGPLKMIIAASGRLNPGVGDPAHWQIEAEIPETCIAPLEVGQEVDCVADAFPDRPFKGKLIQLEDAPKFEQQTANYSAVIQIAATELKFRRGMSVMLAFVIAERQDALRIPSQALFFQMPGTPTDSSEPRGSRFGFTPRELAAPDAAKRTARTVWVVREPGKQPEPVPIRIGISDGGLTEVVEGLHEGDRVVIGIREKSTSPGQPSENAADGKSASETGGADSEPRRTSTLSQPGADDVANISAEDKLANGDPQQRFFLIGPKGSTAPPTNGYPLLLVLPGGDGGPDFLAFVKRMYLRAVPNQYLVAELIAPKWDPQQAKYLVWPSEPLPYPSVKISTEAFVHAVIGEVEKQYRLDPRRIFTLSWSSGGPAGYAASFYKGTRITGSFIAMSVFEPPPLPDLKVVQGQVYFLLHSPDDKLIPISMVQRARDWLIENGGQATLVTYPGGHGWRGNVYGNINDGIQWLDQHATARSASSAGKNQ